MIDYYLSRKFTDKSADRDRNCYISLKEAFEAARDEIMTKIVYTEQGSFSIHPQIYDPLDISSNAYLGEYNVSLPPGYS